MRSINKVILIGNLTRDPELRQTPNGQNVVTFGMATNREWVTKDGRKQNSAEFHELVAWARLADICSTHLKKGKLVYVEGYLKTRSWDAPDGTKKFRTEIVVQDMIMLDKKNRDEDTYIPEGNDEDNTDASESTDTSANSVTEEQPQKEAPKMEESAPTETTKETETPKEETPQPALSETPENTEKKEVAEPTPSSQPDKLDIDSDLGL